MKKNLLLFTFLFLTLFFTACNEKKQNPDKNETNAVKNSDSQYTDENLAAARANFKTVIVDNSFVGDGTPAKPPKDIFSLVHYPATDGDMAAYVSPDPKDGKKHPAIIWIVGGYGGIGSDDFFWTEQPRENDQTGSAFR